MKTWYKQFDYYGFNYKIIVHLHIDSSNIEVESLDYFERYFSTANNLAELLDTARKNFEFWADRQFNQLYGKTGSELLKLGYTQL